MIYIKGEWSIILARIELINKQPMKVIVNIGFIVLTLIAAIIAYSVAGIINGIINDTDTIKSWYLFLFANGAAYITMSQIYLKLNRMSKAAYTVSIILYTLITTLSLVHLKYQWYHYVILAIIFFTALSYSPDRMSKMKFGDE